MLALMRDDLVSFQQLIDVCFNHTALLKQALVHSSYLNENPGFVPASNERLEFLGDAVLGVIIAEVLYRECPDCPEGELTKLRSRLVRRETLARKALDIKLNEYLFLGKGEESGGGRLKMMNLAGAFEALIGAVFLEQGLPGAKQFVLKLLGQELKEAISRGEEIDYKSRLQQVVQAKYQLQPVYFVIETSGPDHDRTFVIETRAGDMVLGKGTGKNKKAAETEAARDALERPDLWG